MNVVVFMLSAAFIRRVNNLLFPSTILGLLITMEVKAQEALYKSTQNHSNMLDMVGSRESNKILQ